MPTRRDILTAIATAACIVVTGCEPANGPYSVTIAPEPVISTPA